MSCNCGTLSYNGGCGCQSNFDGMKNHFTDRQIKDIKDKFEDNLFMKAYYADEEAYSELFGKKKAKKGISDTPVPKKKLDLKKVANDGIGFLKKVGNMLKGDEQVMSGEYEGTKYEVTANPEKETPAPSSQKKEIFGMPPAVVITAGIVILVIVIFIIIKITQNKSYDSRIAN